MRERTVLSNIYINLPAHQSPIELSYIPNAESE